MHAHKYTHRSAYIEVRSARTEVHAQKCTHRSAKCAHRSARTECAHRSARTEVCAHKCTLTSARTQVQQKCAHTSDTKKCTQFINQGAIEYLLLRRMPGGCFKYHVWALWLCKSYRNVPSRLHCREVEERRSRERKADIDNARTMVQSFASYLVC